MSNNEYNDNNNIISLSIHGHTESVTIPKGEEEFAENMIAAGRHAARCKICEQKLLGMCQEVAEHAKSALT